VRSRILLGTSLVFGSGLCALLYQTTWLREFRLIFGNSTAASAAVIGIFMGGLGFGSALLGGRAEMAKRPLAFYAGLEFFIAISAALTPTLVSLIRTVYIACGGTLAMGAFVSTGARLLLAAVVLAVPTILMGGTLPAMARFAVSDRDASRRGLALLYGMNTLGAVVGASAGTFFLLERFGNHATLYFACVLNVTIAGLAWIAARAEQPREDISVTYNVEESRNAPAPARLILGAAALTGFVFLLMELVWYRMLSPILGGTAFTFGLILAVALLGIGSGGVIYSLFVSERRPTLNGFACICALEALCLAIPYGLGDQIALSAMLLRPLAALGFGGRVAGWLGICGIVVFPAAFFAGIQFPMLLGLLGKGREKVGSQTGTAYAWNTAGAIAGSLAGGFGFIPIFTATGTWKLVIVLLVTCALLAAIVSQRKSARPLRTAPIILINTFAVLILIFADGPTAAWRHGQLDRMKKYSATPNETRDLLHSLRRDILWQADGIESSIGISKTNSLAFIVNGKCDGNSKSDAGTQVMSGLLAALAHPNPRRAAVIGLGTGSTTGWIAAIPSIERVDVIELEPAIAKFAAQCAPVNHNALANPKVNLIFGDGRELLMTSKEKYDIVVSEPSNPYRAGVASLFTREFYESVARNLNNGGLFAQWVQGYDVDLRTVRIFYATLSTTFPHIETWQTQNGDLLLICSRTPIGYDVDSMRTRLAAEPFCTALANVWRTTDLEGVFSHFVGNEKFAQTAMGYPGIPLNTDDRMVLEFAFARSRQSDSGINFNDLRRDAALVGADRPITRGALDWKSVEEQRIAMLIAYNGPMRQDDSMPKEQSGLLQAFNGYVAANFNYAWTNWKSLAREPRNLSELALVAECLADRGDDAARPYIDQLNKILPTEAEAIRARLLWREKRIEQATATVQHCIESLRVDPWPSTALVDRTLNVALELIGADNAAGDGQKIFRALQEPFAVYNSDGIRGFALLRASMVLDHGRPGRNVCDSIVALEPNVPWTFGFLRIRSACYTAFEPALAADAQMDLVDYLMAEPGGLESANLPRMEAPDRIVSAVK
jgi:spermidine synthase